MGRPQLQQWCAIEVLGTSDISWFLYCSPLPRLPLKGQTPFLINHLKQPTTAAQSAHAPVSLQSENEERIFGFDFSRAFALGRRRTDRSIQEPTRLRLIRPTLASTVVLPYEWMNFIRSGSLTLCPSTTCKTHTETQSPTFFLFHSQLSLRLPHSDSPSSL